MIILEINTRDMLVTDVLKPRTRHQILIEDPSDLDSLNLLPIIVTKAVGLNRWLILDGNNRAYLKARFGACVDIFEIENDEDKEVLQYYESCGDISPFPHRDFLSNRLTLADMRAEATRHWQKLGCINANELDKWAMLRHVVGQERPLIL